MLPLRPEEKLPAGWIPEGAHGYRDAVFADEATLWRWINACGDKLPNVGMAVGTGHVVIDLDLKEIDGELIDGELRLLQALELRGLELPPTLTQRTANGGQHLIYALPEEYPAVKNAVGILQCVDLRGHDGYIAAEPSVLEGGRRYVIENPDMPPLTIPRPLLEALESLRETRRGHGGGSRPRSDGGNPRGRKEAVDDYVARATREGFRLGNRDASFLYLARDLHWTNASEWAAMEIVEDVWRRTDQDPADYYPLETALEKVTRTYADTRLSSAPDLPTEAQLTWVRGLIMRNEERDAVLEAQAATRQLEAGATDELTGDPYANLDIVSAADVQPELITWLWRNWVPQGKLSLIAGMPEAGKSTLMLEVAATLSAGRPWADGTRPDEPCDTLILTAEDGLSDTVIPRLIAAGADLRRVKIWRGVKKIINERSGEVATVTPIFPEDTGELRKAIAQHAPRLVIIDVLNAYLSGKIDSYRDTDIRRALMPLAKLAEETGIAIVGIVHLNKSTGSTVLTRINGSMGYAGTARVVMLAGVDPDDEANERRVLLVGKSNIGKKPSPLAYHIISYGTSLCESSKIVWDGESEQTAASILTEGASERAGGAPASVDWLAAQFAENRELTQRELAQKFARETGKSEQTLSRLADQLGVQKTRVGFGRGSLAIWIYPPKVVVE